jgi:hypothetical protein
MKIKVREIINTIIPKYVYTGRKNIFNLNITDRFKYLILPVRIIVPPTVLNNNFLLFYDGGTGPWPWNDDIRNMPGRNEVAAFNALGAQRMPFTQLSDPYYLWKTDGLPGQTTGWTNNQPTGSLRYGEGYDTSAFNYVTTREMNGLVRSLVLQGITASDTRYIYINWFEDHRDIGNFGFGVMTGPSDSVDLITFDGTNYIEQPRAVISQNNQGKTNRQNFTELSNTIAKIISGGTGTDGVPFNGLKYYFPKCKFGVYNWPTWNYYFHDSLNNATITNQELQNRIDFYANAFINGMSGALDSLDMFMPSFYCSLNSPDMNRLRSIQGVSMCVAINKKLTQQGKTTKKIIPFVTPLYNTIATGSPYSRQSYETEYYYTPPSTVMLDQETNYQQLDPIVSGGGDGATVWISGAYLTLQIMGRVTDGQYEDKAPQASSRKWPFLHPGGSTAGINQWSEKSMLRQAISAQYNYIKGVCLGITGNRWWWASAGTTTARSTAETYTPLEWLPLGISLSPYGNKVAYSNGTSVTGATSSDATLNIVREVLEDSKYRMLTEFIDLWNTKYNG